MRQLGSTAAAILLGFAGEAISNEVGNKERVCDRTDRHIQCHWSGGGTADYDLGPTETLSYSHPVLAFSYGQTVHIIAPPCEIVCKP